MNQTLLVLFSLSLVVGIMVPAYAQTDSDSVEITISSEKNSYLFGEVAVITGNVSEQVFIEKPFFQPEQIVVNITGPNFTKNITLYPDYDLNYQTSLNLNQVLGINEGDYAVSASYAGASVDTTFSVEFESIEQQVKEDDSFTIATDKPQYIPGQQVSITGFASDIIPLEGMYFTVTNTQGEIISNGNLYPTNGEFATTVFLTTVNPVYGVFEVYAEYSDKSSMITFEVLEDFKEDVPISLWTDKIAYDLGDKVEITGRLNDIWISTLDLEIVHTKQSALIDSTSGSDSGFKILDGLTINGDGSFDYTFTIPDNQQRLGDYRINVSQDIGSQSTVIHVVSDPDEFVVSSTPLTINSDKEIYDLGDTMYLSGFIEDPYSISSYTTGTPVKISIIHEDGTPLEIIGSSGNSNSLTNDGVLVTYDFTAVPDSSGSYSTQIDITKSIFSEGNYVIQAQYLDTIATKTFSLVNPFDLKDGATISLDKEVYGLNETVYLTGLVPPTGSNSVEISLTKPDGTKINSGADIDSQRFSWSWNTPIAEKTQNIKIDDERDVVKSNFGVYKLRVATDSESRDLFFKISEDPENDSLSTIPIFVTTEKSLYKAGDTLKVLGNVIKREQGDEGLVIPDRVTIKVLDGTFPYKQIHESSVYPNQGGEFSSLFELPATIFSEGSYSVKAFYTNIQTDTTFSVTNDFIFGLDEPVSLLLSTDKPEYHPGDTVVITGKPNKLIYLEKFDVSVIQKTDTEITCGTFYCGTHVGSITSIRPSPSGSFTHQFQVSDSTTSIGSYEITVDADFETKSITFNVVEQPQTPKLDIIIEKENRISDSMIPILIEEKTIDDTTVAPRVISGSLITPTRSDEPNVNLKVSTETGVCVIGSDAECLVKESTRKPGQIYDVVEADGVNLNVRYSGPDVRLEKFSILPESNTDFLSNADWNVEVVKDEQISRFYYKITYKTLE